MMTQIDIDNIYDPTKTPTDQETKSLAWVIMQAIRTNQLELHTAFPAEITAVTTPGFLVSVQPLLKRRFMDASVEPLPIIQNVPVVMPNGARYSIRVPVAVGDTGLCVVSERSLDVWKIHGGTVDPQDTRLHHLSDAVFIPGLYPMDDPVTVQGSPTSMQFNNWQGIIVIEQDGTMKFQNKLKSVELIDQLVQLVQAIEAMTVSTMIGPQPPINLATFTAIRSKLEMLKVT